MAPRPRLLYLSPVVPAATGNGLAMRAGMVLELLARQHRVSLLVVSLYASPAARVPRQIAGVCRQSVVVTPGRVVPAPSSPTRLALPAWVRGVARAAFARDRRGWRPAAAFRDEPFEIVHVFRLSMLPFARPWLDPVAGHMPERHLDLDDVESTTRRRLAALYRTNGDEAMARFEGAEAERCEALENDVLERFDRVYVCSEADKAALCARARTQVCVLPNALPVPPPLPPKPAAPAAAGTRPFTFLFVGTLGYYPNADGIQHFCTQVVPRIRQMTRRGLSVAVVGTGATTAIQALELIPEVRLIGAVPDVAPWYRDADAVVVPVRAGGGTRIKVLEAFAYRRPVVSTPVGIEGIDAQDGEHVLVGDTPEAFAERCLRLMEDSELAERLAEQAYALFTRAYSTEAVARTFADASPPPPARGS